jgi:hypothetical protein
MRQNLRMFAPLLINFAMVAGIMLAYLVALTLLVLAGGIR